MYLRIQVIKGDTRRKNDVGLTSARRRHKDVSTTYFNVMRMQGVGCRKFASHAMFILRFSRTAPTLQYLQKTGRFLDFMKHSFLAHHMSMVKLI